MESSARKSSICRPDNMVDYSFEPKIDCREGNGIMKSVPSLPAAPQPKEYYGFDLQAYMDNKQKSSLSLYKNLCKELGQEKTKFESLQALNMNLKTDIYSKTSEMNRLKDLFRKDKETKQKSNERMEKSIVSALRKFQTLIDDMSSLNPKIIYENLMVCLYDRWTIAKSHSHNIELHTIHNNQLSKEKVVVKKVIKRNMEFSRLNVFNLDLFEFCNDKIATQMKSDPSPFSKILAPAITATQHNPFKSSSMEVEDTKIQSVNTLLNQNITVEKANNPFQAIMQNQREAANLFQTSNVNNPFQVPQFDQINQCGLYSAISQPQPQTQPQPHPQFNSIVNMSNSNNSNYNPFLISNNIQPIGTSSSQIQLSNNYTVGYLSNNILPKQQLPSNVSSLGSNPNQVNQSNPFFSVPTRRR